MLITFAPTLMSRRSTSIALASAIAIVLPHCVSAQTAPAAVVAGIPVNYDETRVGTYTLPDPLVLANGKPVRDAKIWDTERRPEIVKMFEDLQFGRAPGRPADLWFRATEAAAPALDGKAVRRQVTVFFTKDSAGPKVDLLLYLPATARGPVPVLLNVSFSANANTIDDAGVKPGMIWTRDGTRVIRPVQRPGTGLGQINPLPFLAQGFGFATLYYGDIDPDFAGGAMLGARATYIAPGQSMPAANEWGTIAAWAWGLSRVMDYLETDSGVDAKRVALVGVSRIGKTVLWAGARDTRFAMVIASCSGESGAALSRRNYGETVAHMTASSRYAYQFAGNYGTYGDRVAQLPMDGHMLVSLIAPRPVLLQTGDTDGWSDPKGEFLSAVAASPVFTLLGARGLETDVMPAAGVPILNTLGFYMHAGGHGTIPSDWDIFLTFMRQHFK